MKFDLRAAAAVALAAACWVLPALAGPAVLYRDADMRAGPGDQHAVLWTLVAGTHVDVRECRPDAWCRVIRRDKQGWLKLDTLDLRPGVDEPHEHAAAAASKDGTAPQAAGQRAGGGSQKSRFTGTPAENYAGLGDGPPGGAIPATAVKKSGDTPDAGSSGPGGGNVTITTAYPTMGGAGVSLGSSSSDGGGGGSSCQRCAP